MKRKPDTVPCVGCGITLENRNRLGRSRRRCLDCRYILQLKLAREWRKRNPEYHRNYSRAYRFPPTPTEPEEPKPCSSPAPSPSMAP